jgi:hypothetical protein
VGYEFAGRKIAGKLQFLKGVFIFKGATWDEPLGSAKGLSMKRLAN